MIVTDIKITTDIVNFVETFAAWKLKFIDHGNRVIINLSETLSKDLIIEYIKARRFAREIFETDFESDISIKAYFIMGNIRNNDNQGEAEVVIIIK